MPTPTTPDTHPGQNAAQTTEAPKAGAPQTLAAALARIAELESQLGQRLEIDPLATALPFVGRLGFGYQGQGPTEESRRLGWTEAKRVYHARASVLRAVNRVLPSMLGGALGPTLQPPVLTFCDALGYRLQWLAHAAGYVGGLEYAAPCLDPWTVVWRAASRSGGEALRSMVLLAWMGHAPAKSRPPLDLLDRLPEIERTMSVDVRACFAWPETLQGAKAA